LQRVPSPIAASLARYFPVHTTARSARFFAVRVLAQTRARVRRGNTHHPDTVLRLFEQQTEAIRKGKAAKPTEFGKVVKVREAEAGLVTDDAVCPTRVPD
jgi:hypothetical protein